MNALSWGLSFEKMCRFTLALSLSPFSHSILDQEQKTATKPAVAFCSFGSTSGFGAALSGSGSGGGGGWLKTSGNTTESSWLVKPPEGEKAAPFGSNFGGFSGFGTLFSAEASGTTPAPFKFSLGKGVEVPPLAAAAVATATTKAAGEGAASGAEGAGSEDEAEGDVGGGAEDGNDADGGGGFEGLAPTFAPAVQVVEAEQATGEEGEEAVLTLAAKLFKLQPKPPRNPDLGAAVGAVPPAAEWCEKGKGSIRVVVPRDGNDGAGAAGGRLVMRREKTEVRGSATFVPAR